MKTVLITGANGMLAHDLINELDGTWNLLCTDVDQLDITDPYIVDRYFSAHSIDVCINCAAYTAVDHAEQEGKNLAYQVNVIGQLNLAQACTKYSVGCVTISTDYVFDGTKQEGYLPSDEPSPLSQYGISKYLGEQVVHAVCPSATIVRTSRLYGGGKDYKNFVNTMIRLGKQRKSLKVVDDQYGLPTYTVDLSLYLHHILQNLSQYVGRTVHANNSGEICSRYGFTSEIFDQIGINIDLIPCGTEDYPLPAPRPAYSMMVSDDSTFVFSDWKDALRRYVERVGV